MNSEGIYEPPKTLSFVSPSKINHIPQEEYDQLVEPYREAMTRLEVRMNGLNEDYRKKYRDYPIHNIQARIKSRKSIEKKLDSLHCQGQFDRYRRNPRHLLFCGGYFQYSLTGKGTDRPLNLKGKRLYPLSEREWLQELSYGAGHSCVPY